MEWSKENTLQLIEEYRKHDCLWNQTVGSHKDKQMRFDAWQEIAKVFQCEYTEVEKKMRSVIGQFQREMKKLKGHSGDGVDDDSRRWFAFKNLMFLRDKWKPHKTTDVKVEKQLSSGEDTEGIMDQSISADDSADEASVNEVTETVESTSGEKKIFKSPNKRKHKFSAWNMSSSDDQGNMVNEAYDVMKNISSSGLNKDDSQVYGDYVASKLRRLNENARNTVQHMINDILYWAALGKYDNPPHMGGDEYYLAHYYSSSSTIEENPLQSP